MHKYLLSRRRAESVQPKNEEDDSEHEFDENDITSVLLRDLPDEDDSFAPNDADETSSEEAPDSPEEHV